MIAQFFASAVLLVAAWSVQVEHQGITASWRYDGFRAEYVVTLDGLPEVPVSSAPVSVANQGPAHDVVCAHFPGQCEFAYRVFMCESRLDPTAVGRAGERGAAQIHPIWWPVYGVPPAGLDGQMAQAARIVADIGWRHWSCS